MLPNRHYIYYKNNIPKNKGSKIKIFISKLFLILGLLIIIWVAYPILAFQFINSQQIANKQFISPIGLNQSFTQASTDKKIDTDYTNPNNWFPDAPVQNNIAKIKDYKLSIPKLGINQAIVNLTGEDLSKSLIHYGGTAPPGKTGNGVIFGHSILPQFYNPKNYMTIFSTIHTLKNGDQILINYDHITYQYQVTDMFEVTPQDISVLDQPTDDKYISLITCTPPGTFLRRLVVKAKLIPYQK